MKKIAIHSVPRSGSSWVGQLFNSSPKVSFRFQPLFSYAFKGGLDENSSKNDIEIFFDEISKSNDDFLLQKDKVESGIYPGFDKDHIITHVAYKEVRYHHILENLLQQDSELKVIGIIRSPFSVINSFLQSPREFRRDLGWSELEEWRLASKKNLDKKEEFYGYEKWKEVTLLFFKLKEKYPNNFYLLSYDDLLQDTKAKIIEAFNFCDLDVNQQTIEFLDASKNVNKKDTYSVYKRKSSDRGWIETLNHKISSEIKLDLQESGLVDFF